MPHGLAGEGLGWDPRAVVSNISTPHLCSSPQHSARLLQLIYTTEASAQTHKYRFQQIMISLSTLLPLALSTACSATRAKKHLEMNSDTLIGPHLLMSGLQIFSFPFIFSFSFLFSYFFKYFLLEYSFFTTLCQFVSFPKELLRMRSSLNHNVKKENEYAFSLQLSPER